MYPENISLVEVISGLPGIVDVISNIDNRKNTEPIRIFFRVSEINNKGLFLLTRCTDRRYWKYGYLWKIELTVGDSYDEYLPINYMLHSGDVVGDDAIKQAEHLIKNINNHFTNNNFLEYFKIDKNYFKKEFISNRRKLKISNIDINNDRISHQK